MKALILLVALLATTPIFAQTDTLNSTNSKVSSSNSNQDTNLTLLAEKNGYPSPDKVLKLKSALKLNPEQQSKIVVIADELHRKIKEMQNFITTQENKLEQLFISDKINDGSLIFYTNKIGALQGELEHAQLKAHYQTKKALNPQQLKLYKELSIKLK